MGPTRSSRRRADGTPERPNGYSTRTMFNDCSSSLSYLLAQQVL